MLLRQIPIPHLTSPLKGEEHNDFPPLQGLCRNMKKPNAGKGGEAVGRKRFRAVTFSRSKPGVLII